MPDKRPNVILVLTDDQGYADLGCTGNPRIQTPNIDAFAGESLRFSDFHVSPLCTPTRGALMTGRRPVRNGAWATCWGRSILRADETTIADAFAAGGYRTGMFGKWHLGDNAPYRPQDRGFQRVVAHKGGGVGQTPDFWGNNYFDDTYFANGEPVECPGYCTDVWFDAAGEFIAEASAAGEPFFAYIATNAPHSPYLVEERYAAPYRDDEQIVSPEFYGMIANIDENFARLRERLDELGIADDTILMFMTDNGSSGGCETDADGFVTRGYNAGLRGKKGSRYDGGHRAPWLVRWPAGGVDRGRAIDEMSLHVDVMPTLIELCGLDAPEGVTFDGVSLASLIRGDADRIDADRVHHVNLRQGTEPPDIWDGAVMTRRWRLVYGDELYDITADPGQTRDVAGQHPHVVASLRQAQEAWWDEVSPTFEKFAAIDLGNDAENPTRLDSMDVHGDVAWNQCHVAEARHSSGRWAVNVARAGRYRFALRRWPEELDLPLDAGISPDAADRLAPYQPHTTPAELHPTTAGVKLFGESHTAEVASGQKEVAFELQLDQAGETRMEAWFADADDNRHGAYYVYVERLTE